MGVKNKITTSDEGWMSKEEIDKMVQDVKEYIT